MFLLADDAVRSFVVGVVIAPVVIGADTRDWQGCVVIASEASANEHAALLDYCCGATATRDACRNAKRPRPFQGSGVFRECPNCP